MQVTKFNLVTDLQIMLSNVTHSNFYFECNTDRGSIDQLYVYRTGPNIYGQEGSRAHRRWPKFGTSWHISSNL